MSAYTTEVRYICEYEAGLTESVGFNDVDSVIEKSWDKIFKNFPIFDEEYRKPLCMKILQHYYKREICAETTGLWKFWLNQRMREIMPYYNQLYRSESLKFDPLNEISLTRIINEEVTGNTARDESGTTVANESAKDEHITKNDGYIEDSGSTDTTIENKNNSKTQDVTTTSDNFSGTEESNGKNLHSDTPQGSLQNITENGYLTDATITSDTRTSNNEKTGNINKNMNTDSTNTSTETTLNGNVRTIKGDASNISNTSNNSNTNINRSDTENKEERRILTETLNGKNSSLSYSKLISEYRETFLNIDLEIIINLSDLFMNIY